MWLGLWLGYDESVGLLMLGEMLKVVKFDFDGVIYDVEWVVCVDKMFWQNEGIGFVFEIVVYVVFGKVIF